MSILKGKNYKQELIMRISGEILTKLIFLIAFSLLYAENIATFDKGRDTRISVPTGVFFPKKDSISEKINLVKIEKWDNSFYQTDSNKFICMDSVLSIELAKFKSNDPGYYKIVPLTNQLDIQSFKNKTSAGFFWVYDTIGQNEPWDKIWPLFGERFSGIYGRLTRPWIYRKWLRASTNWHLRKGGVWPWNTDSTNYICLRGENKKHFNDTLFSPNIAYPDCNDSLYLQFRVLFWPKRQNARFNARLIYSTNGGKTWPYTLKSYKNYENGYEKFTIRLNQSAPKGKLMLAWVFSGDLTDIVAWCIDDVILSPSIVVWYDIEVSEICWPPEVITPNDTQSVSFVISNFGSLGAKNIKTEAWIGNAHAEKIVSKLSLFERRLIKLKIPVLIEGNYLMKITINSLDEDAPDGCPGNDTLTDSLFVISLPPDTLNGDAEIFEVSSGFLKLYQNYPNPFNRMAMIRYRCPQLAKVNLIVYDITGRVVRKLVDGEEKEGYNAVFWDGRADNGRKMPSGVYFYRLENDEISLIKKIIKIE